jgi:hypothetical protein
MSILQRAFTRMGARVKFASIEPGWPTRTRVPIELALDVREDNRGEYFLISRNPAIAVELVVLDVQPKDRHLVLLSRNGTEKHRYLLGHDERHWFVAGIPEVTPVSRVRDAMHALKPEAVQIGEIGLRLKQRNRRSNEARIRQGEWFFVPALNALVEAWTILRNEPLVRSRGGKPHTCQELYRYGGETVYVSSAAPNGLTEAEYASLSDHERRIRTWRVMRRNPKVFARGTVRHPDHKTVMLNGWHEVLSNTEHLSFAMRDIAFLD